MRNGLEVLLSVDFFYLDLEVVLGMVIFGDNPRPEFFTFLILFFGIDSLLADFDPFLFFFR